MSAAPKNARTIYARAAQPSTNQTPHPRLVALRALFASFGLMALVGPLCLPTSVRARDFTNSEATPAISHWGTAGAITGFVGSGVGLALGIGSAVAAEADSTGVGIGLGGGSLLSLGVTTPIAFAGGASSRRAGGRGFLGLRIASWIGYGATMLGGTVLIAAAAAGADIGAAGVAPVIIVGTASDVMMSTDALIASRQANQLSAMRPGERTPAGSLAQRRSDRSLLTLAPFVSPPMNDRPGFVGITGRF